MLFVSQAANKKALLTPVATGINGYCGGEAADPSLLAIFVAFAGDGCIHVQQQVIQPVLCTLCDTLCESFGTNLYILFSLTLAFVYCMW